MAQSRSSSGVDKIPIESLVTGNKPEYRPAIRLNGNSSFGVGRFDCRYVSVPLHAAAILLGVVVLIGWANAPSSAGLHGKLLLMKPFTALFFVLTGSIGACQALWPEERRTLRSIIAIFIFLVSAIFAFENTSSLRTGIDSLLFSKQAAAVDPSATSGMALGTALAFMFIASSFLAQLTGRNEIAAWMLLVPLCIGALALLGYGYGVRELYAFGSLNALALHTAVGLCTVSVAAWCSLRHNRMLQMLTSATPHARALRRIGPPLILVPFLLGILETQLVQDRSMRPAAASAAITLVQIIILGALLGWHLLTVYREQELRAAAEADREDYLHRLTENEERLRLALSGGNIGWWELDPHTFKNRMAPETAALFGLPRDDTSGSLDIIRRCIHPDDREPWMNAFERALRSDGNYSAEYRVVWPDGTIHWIASRGRIVRDAEGKPQRAVGLVTDITQRRRAEEAVRASEQKFRRIFETANEGIWVLDAESRIEMVNPRMAEMLGYAEAELLGRKKADFVVPEDVPLAQKQFERRRRNISEEFELRLRHRDGHEVWASFAARAVVEDGQFIGVLDMITDITERKRAELELARAQEQLRQHAQTLEQRVAERTAALQETIMQLEAFSYSITHDMRGPLRAISGFAGIIEQEHGAQLDEAARGYLRRMTSAAQRLDSLIQDVLDFSRISKGEMLLNRIQLSELIDEIIQQYPNLAAQKAHIHLGCVEFHVRANLAALTQALSNLIGNALKFVAPGQEPDVRIECELIENYVRIWIIDNGIGIAPEYREKIWGAFQRLHQTDEYPGTGIGLAIVKKAAERMGGRVGVESTPGKGSRFWLDLPQA